MGPDPANELLRIPPEKHLWHCPTCPRYAHHGDTAEDIEARHSSPAGQDRSDIVALIDAACMENAVLRCLDEGMPDT
jgi:hypothetical protein